MEKVNAFLNLLNNQILQSKQSNLSPQEYLASATAAVDALFDLTKTLSDELDNLITAHLHEHFRERLFTLGVSSFIFVALAFGLFFGFFIVTTEGIERVVSNARQLGNEIFQKS